MSLTYHEWVDQNPYRKFHTDKGWAQHRAAIAVGVTQNTLRTWFFGGVMPNVDSLQAIADVMGISFEDLNGEWHDWLANRPEESGNAA